MLKIVAFGWVLSALVAAEPAVRADAADANIGAITFTVTDAHKKGVVDVTFTVSINGSDQTATTGSEQPSDAELAAAAKQSSKAVDALNDRYKSRAALAGLALGTAIVTVDLKNAKPITIAFTADKPTWTVSLVVDPKAKKTIGAPKIVFDEVAAAKSRAERAEAEAAKANADAAQARADRDRADQAEADAAKAKDQADAERVKRQREEARSKISTAPLGCTCGKGHTIVVTCRVASAAEVPVDVMIDAKSETGTFNVGASGKRMVTGLGAGQTFDLQVPTAFSAVKDCSSCKNSSCAISVVMAK